MDVIIELLPGFLLTLITSTLIVGVAYNRNNAGTPEHGFSCLIFSNLLYFVIIVLRDVQLSLGLSFGLLAIFSLLNYRTFNIPVKGVTYIFICITLPLINTFSGVARVTFLEMAVLNAFIFLFTLGIEWWLSATQSSSKLVLYEKIELIAPEKRQQLLEDLRVRTGLNVTRVAIEEIDFLRDTAEMRIYYEDKKQATA
jgi:hypothetical protein